MWKTREGLGWLNPYDRRNWGYAVDVAEAAARAGFDEIMFDYVPGVGTSMVVKGKTMGTLAGTDFMKMLFSVYLGPKPPTADLKKGMLGG